MLPSLYSFNQYKRAFIEQDFKAGVTVFLVALPLCLGIALASGAPLLSGLTAGIIAGVIVAWFSGSELSVSGPAAGLTVIVAGAITSIGSFNGFLVAVFLAGIIQLCLGIFKFGKLGSYFPESVIKGMLVAIGIVIILKQVPHALGDDGDYEGEFEFFQIADKENTLTELIKSFLNLNPGALLISLCCIGLLVAWDKASKKGIAFFKKVPSALIAVLLGIAINESYQYIYPTWYLGESKIHMVSLPILSSLGEISMLLHFPDFTFLTDPKVYTTAFTLAIVASLETLLNLEAADSIDPKKRLSSPDQELKAQGIGNIVAGLIGGLPVTSVVVRTSANVYGGGTTRMSSFTHGLLLLICTLAIPGLLNHIPLASLAAILLTVGYKLANPAIFRGVYKNGIDQYIPFLITIILVVFTDLLMGIFMGLLVGIGFVIYSNYQSVITVVRDQNRVLIRFNKDVSFLNKPLLKTTLMGLKEGDLVFVEASGSVFIDNDIFNLLKEFKSASKIKKLEIYFKNISRKKIQFPNQTQDKIETL
ncbi:MAG: SulP family inorganic anion transporter [Spirosomataceae bacterium]